MFPSRLIPILLIAATVSVLPASSARAETPGAPVSQDRLSVAARFGGYGSCLARGCHGGASAQRPGIAVDWQNAASIWMQHDRHAEAYRVLLTTRSQQIVNLLTPEGETPKKPQETARCLACHTSPVLAAATESPHVLAGRREGVSCEACHTADGRSSLEWIDSHARGGRSREVANGMRPLAKASQRAELCVGCHVGSGPKEGLIARDVNHDLIAAGHPRLLFDYATYLERMPRHWDEAATKRQATRPSSPLAEAITGSLSVTIATLELTEARRSSRTDDVLSRRAWPELTEFDCYSCHHDLADVDWRRDPKRRSSPGRMTWLGRELLTPGEWSGDLQPRLDQLATRVESLRAADSTATTELSRQLVSELSNARQRIETSGLTAADLDSVRSALSPATLESANWDEFARRYYLLSVLARESRDTAAHDALKRLGGVLRQPRGPGHTANSPVGFQPRLVHDDYCAVYMAIQPSLPPAEAKQDVSARNGAE